MSLTTNISLSNTGANMTDENFHETTVLLQGSKRAIRRFVNELMQQAD
jgi:hypothetical protein